MRSFTQKKLTEKKKNEESKELRVWAKERKNGIRN